MAAYLILGLIGLPVFARGESGLGALAGPTGGYLIGFVLCPLVTGALAKLRKNPGALWYGLSMAAGTLAIYAFGVLQLSVVMRLSLEKAAIFGALPFIPGDALKVVAASLVARRLKLDSGGRR
jgi:biotin transport system substrate-specific component